MSSGTVHNSADRQAAGQRLRLALRLADEARAMRLSLPRGDERIEWALIAEACRREVKRAGNALGRLQRGVA